MPQENILNPRPQPSPEQAATSAHVNPDSNSPTSEGAGGTNKDSASLAAELEARKEEE